MVTIRCICPPTATGQTRHANGDEVTLRERLDFRGAVACRNAIFMAKNEDPDCSIAEIAALLTEHYLLEGVVGWTLVDDKGKRVEVTKARIRDMLLTHIDEAMEVGEAADDLYSESVMRPLVAMGQRSSPPTPTNESTSPTNGSGRKRRTPSKPSSITTSQTDDTDPTSLSLAIGSNSSQNSR